MSLGAPEPLGARHRIDTFDCGKPALNLWLARHARQAKTSGSAKTFVVSDEDCIGGYYSLTVGQVDTMDAPERVRQGMGQKGYPLNSLSHHPLCLTSTAQHKGMRITGVKWIRPPVIPNSADPNSARSR